ncbi:putative signal transducing protein [Mangrovibacterium diazotrophicum]|uniref:Putative signal transducing protein n=1 Tax=Mangrovibacterium diazotrophicum TaxID=1261403 RepID=A0A419VV17_9BACT|nr:DUF2007 domain-containing protein [Mangrovibacterium diazotrophicum]RKD86000.1 putative signal transducing protein [Mangrovibacterium diazotrophicum]
MGHQWKTILTFTYPHEAHMAKAYLESNEIMVIVVDELTAQVNSFYSNAIGGVKLLVPEAEIEAATELLERGGYIVSKDEASKMELIRPDRLTDKTLCPYCQSRNIAKKRDPNILVVVVYFLLGAIFPIFKAGYQCFDCGKEWKYEKG